VGWRPRRSPTVAITSRGVLVRPLRMLQDERAHFVDVVAPDRVEEFACLGQPRSARCFIAACQDKLGIRQLGTRRVDTLVVIPGKLLDCARLPEPDSSK